jgi:hypothetical protein
VRGRFEPLCSPPADQRSPSRLDLLSAIRKCAFIFANRVCRIDLESRKTMWPGTISTISVPEPAELKKLNLLPIRAARSRMP